MRNNETVETTTKQMMTTVTHTVDCFRKIKDPESGVVEVKRWVEERQRSVNLMSALGGVFFNGARVA